MSCTTPAGLGNVNASATPSPGLVFDNTPSSIIFVTSLNAVVILLEALLDPVALDPSVVTETFNKSLALFIPAIVCVICVDCVYCAFPLL